MIYRLGDDEYPSRRAMVEDMIEQLCGHLSVPMLQMLSPEEVADEAIKRWRLDQVEEGEQDTHMQRYGYDHADLSQMALTVMGRREWDLLAEIAEEQKRKRQQ